MPDPPERNQPLEVHDDQDEQELLDTGQEEVFSRTEVELGRIEHCSEAGKAAAATPKPHG